MPVTSGWPRRALAAVACLICVLAAASLARAETVVLYDGAVAGETPAEQGFFFVSRPSPPAAARAAYSAGGTTLDTLGEPGEYAGYTVRDASRPLDRAAGFTLRFTTQVITETHLDADRAGLSVLLLASDARGIELAFWEDEVWAQNDGARIFTHGEGAALDTTAGPTAYALTLQGDRYSLAAGGRVVLEGPLRDYRFHPSYPPQQFPFYYIPNYLFIGDNTSDAAVAARIFFVSLSAAAPTPPPPSATPRPSATPTPRAGPDELGSELFLPLVLR